MTQAFSGDQRLTLVSRHWRPRTARYGSSLFASVLIDHDFAAKRIQALMGHVSIVMTYDLYGHLFELKESDHDRLAAAEPAVGLRPATEMQQNRQEWRFSYPGRDNAFLMLFTAQWERSPGGGLANDSAAPRSTGARL